MALTIDVISDVVCPWCYIGKKKLERAIELYAAEHPGEAAPEVTWHPFQLNPDLPPEGITRTDYLTRKFGSPTGGPGYGRVSGEGKKLGIDFAFDKIIRQPNTVVPHSIITLAGRAGNQDAIVNAFFRAYFLEGRDLTANDVVRDIAVGAGLPPDDVDAALSSEELRAFVGEADENARRLGVSGVPFFIFNRKVAVSGAHDPEVLLQAIQQAEAADGGASESPA
jgi:predicted DsbA family dithiol-disulfide isomerase